jgi:hypothetical protein
MWRLPPAAYALQLPDPLCLKGMPLLLDDFSRDADVRGSLWRAFSDRVMGGISNVVAGFEVVRGRRALRMRGEVSLERNGGFVQVARPFGRGALDARQYGGIELTVCGSVGSYFVHLRTTDCRAPWQYYAASLPVSAAWNTITIPWSAFAPAALRARMNVAALERIGVVAAQAEFTADIALARLALVP